LGIFKHAQKFFKIELFSARLFCISLQKNQGFSVITNDLVSGVEYDGLFAGEFGGIFFLTKDVLSAT
jgi:hypothetical protein